MGVRLDTGQSHQPVEWNRMGNTFVSVFLDKYYCLIKITLGLALGS